MRKLVALTALAFVAILAAACGTSDESNSTPPLAATQTPGDTLTPSAVPTVSPSPTLSFALTSTRVPPEEVADLTGRLLFDVAFIPEGFIENPDVLIEERLNPVKRTKRVRRTWKWEEDPSISFSIEERPGTGTLSLGGENESVAIRNDIIGELALTGPKEGRPYPVLFLVWKDKANYYLRAQTGGPLTEEVVLKIAASVQAGY